MEDAEIVLEKHNKKSWFKSLLLGFIMGIAVIVPGISGSTVAIIFKLYDKFLYAMSNLFKKFVMCFLFLLPIGIGIVIGFALGFFTIRELLNILPFAITGLFAGLMMGAFPAVKDEIKGERITTKRVIILIVSILIPIAIGVLSVFLPGDKAVEGGSLTSKLDNIDFLKIMLFLPIGYIVAITQIVPGLSATAVLMAIGYFKPLMESFHREYWSSNPMIFGVYASLGIGFLIGLFTFSKFLTFLFKKARATTYFAIVGLSLGSIMSMFFNPDTYDIYVKWAQGDSQMKLDLPLGIVLLAIGMTISYLLILYERKKKAAPAIEKEE